MYHHLEGELKLIATYKQRASLEKFMEKNKLAKTKHIVLKSENEFRLYEKKIISTYYDGEFLDIYKDGDVIKFDTTFPVDRRDIDQLIEKQIEDIFNF